MKTRLLPLVSAALALAAAPARAEDGSQADAQPRQERAPDAEPAPPPPPPPPFAFARPVFDETWATIGLGVGMVPSYAGSDDYIAFPLPLIAGRVGGVGIAPNGPGFVLDVNSPKPAMAPRKGARLAFGPALRFRNDRSNRISDDVVARAGRLDAALEVGASVAVAWRGVAKPLDQLSIGVQARRDVLGAHAGWVIEPQASYRARVGKAFTLQAQASMEFTDNRFARTYFSVTPAQSAAAGLAQYSADGGLNRIGTTAILSYDLDRNPLNGGWALTGVGGYSRLIGDSAQTPYTSVRGNANQFILGAGAAYTF
ncbi:MipA/OmpV family protein [Porphyrobacter sp. AAP82]|uniref:MipA/OmpV family protein n=1 Tax=Porphyrobacter sp. AAP82 TaxID=1248917 RepID=UPI0002ED4852|nr:MipA/OmpV family protein [Porphyrobacter sp. AAP82]